MPADLTPVETEVANGTEFGPVRRQEPMRHQVYERIRQAIIDGSLPVGQELITSQVAASLGVSRTPVREAFERLTQEGLLQRGSTGVVQIRRVSRQEISDMMSIRAELDAYAARLFVERGLTAPQLTALQDVAQQMEDLGTDPSATQEQLRLNSIFHHIIREGSGNLLLADLIAKAGPLTLSNHLTVLGQQTSIEKNNHEHDAILKAIMNGDGDGAAEAVRLHVYSARDELLAKYVELE